MDAEAGHPEPGGGAGQPPPASGPRPAGRSRLRLRVAVGVLVVVLAAFLYWLHARRYEDTDDAQIDGNVSAVSSRVSGTVTAVHVEDNQTVRAGDVLVELDPTDLQVGLAQARAAVAQAEAAMAAERPSVSITETSNAAAVRGAEADVESARTDLEAAQRDADQAEASARLAVSQLERAKQLVAGGSLAPADYDQQVAAAEVARASAQAYRQRLQGRRAKLDAATTRQREVLQNAPRQLVAREATVQVRQANLELARAQLHQAELDLGYARVVAPAGGIIGRRTVNVGDRIQPGQQLAALTQTGTLWVTANFRETQIRLMRGGQRAEIHVDALARDYGGAVESFAGATGSRYSLLPPENAAGNYVKVVQRVPVRVRLDPGQPELERLRPGMSVEVAVKVR
jgi:membrane fusion protein (multidrug efflux system)